MRAAWYERKGPAREVLHVGEQPIPEPAPGEVRVRLHASGVNPADVKIRMGTSGVMTADYPLVIPNSDGAGIVDAVGEGVHPGWVGRRVWIYNGQRRGRALGTAAEFIALHADLVTDLPDDTSFAEGACLGIPGMTAWHAVFADGPVAGQTVLITGGAGAVGHYAVQLAAWGGARVIATTSGGEKAEHAAAAGAEYVVNYREEYVGGRVMALTNGRGVDRIVDVDFGGNLAASVACIAENGVIATYASDGEREPCLPFHTLMRQSVTMRPFILNGLPKAARDRARFGMLDWLRTGQPRHRVAGVFPLDRIAEAHEAVESGTKLGTVVVDPRA